MPCEVSSTQMCVRLRILRLHLFFVLVCQATLAAVVAVEVRRHENTSTAVLVRALPPQASDLAIVVNPVASSGASDEAVSFKRRASKANSLSSSLGAVDIPVLNTVNVHRPTSGPTVNAPVHACLVHRAFYFLVPYPSTRIPTWH